MTAAVQYVFKANPGADLGVIMATVKESAAIWRKHGAEVSFWAVTAGEVGNFVFAARFDTFEAYGKTLDALDKDPAFSAWRASSLKSGVTSWVRTNVARQIEI